ncbi:hypothetical protein NDU88_002052 [Pleurodeles waltl]|uniref:Uncharacterized protein n=1 Tax=Pleurodeles waltl TaxID=8319 RepID=A0AAV7W1A8_PLEWA|nr:hypothetical protein NDU88_002052 [Pleurodeles waltl]
MGKTDKTQARLQFERRRAQGPTGDGTATDSEKGPEGTPGEEQDLRQLLVSMQHSLNQIDGKIDALAYRMDRMSERIDKHTERLDHVENRVSATEDGQTELVSGQSKLSKELGLLKLKVEDMEARSRRNNIRIVGLAESTAITNMERHIEQLLEGEQWCRSSRRRGHVGSDRESALPTPLSSPTHYQPAEDGTLETQRNKENTCTARY